MANYEHECIKCHHTFTVKHTYTEHDRHKPVKCPKCGSTRTGQLISQVYAKTSKKS
jgi:putative FmdB family regulatory protein